MILCLDGNMIMTQVAHPHDNWMGPGWTVVPPKFEDLCAQYAPFLNVTCGADGEITNIEPDVEAKAAWEAERTTEPQVPPAQTGGLSAQAILDALNGGLA